MLMVVAPSTMILALRMSLLPIIPNNHSRCLNQRKISPPYSKLVKRNLLTVNPTPQLHQNSPSRRLKIMNVTFEQSLVMNSAIKRQRQNFPPSTLIPKKTAMSHVMKMMLRLALTLKKVLIAKSVHGLTSSPVKIVVKLAVNEAMTAMTLTMMNIPLPQKKASSKQLSKSRFPICICPKNNVCSQSKFYTVLNHPATCMSR